MSDKFTVTESLVSSVCGIQVDRLQGSSACGEMSEIKVPVGDRFFLQGQQGLVQVVAISIHQRSDVGCKYVTLQQVLL